MKIGNSHRLFLVPSDPAGVAPRDEFDIRQGIQGIVKSGIVLPSAGEPAYDLGFRYKKGYESQLLKGRDVQPRPWNIYNLIKERISSPAVVADVGCGTAYKSLRLAPLVKLLIGVEPNEEMIEQAVQNALVCGARNVCFVTGSDDDLPFEDETLDLVMGFLAPQNMAELHRVLKPGGWVVFERVGDRDKANVKDYFGADAQGPRGQFLNFGPGERARKLEAEFREKFAHVEMRNGFWETEYSLEELMALLEHTPSVRDFSLTGDHEALERIKTELVKDGHVRTTQNRVLIIAQK